MVFSEQQKQLLKSKSKDGSFRREPLYEQATRLTSKAENIVSLANFQQLSKSNISLNIVISMIEQASAMCQIERHSSGVFALAACGLADVKKLFSVLNLLTKLVEHRGITNRFEMDENITLTLDAIKCLVKEDYSAKEFVFACCLQYILDLIEFDAISPAFNSPVPEDGAHSRVLRSLTDMLIDELKVAEHGDVDRPQPQKSVRTKQESSMIH